MSLSILELSCTHELVSNIFVELCAVCSIISTTCLAQCFNTSAFMKLWHLFFLLLPCNAIALTISNRKSRLLGWAKLIVCVS